MPELAPYSIRRLADVSSPKLNELFTVEKGATLIFELGIGQLGQVRSVGNVASLNFAARAWSGGNPPAEDAPKTLERVLTGAELDNTLTDVSWADGSKAHAVIEFSKDEMSLSEGKHRIHAYVLTAADPSELIQVWVADINISNAAGGLAGDPPDLVESYYSAAEVDGLRVADKTEVQADLSAEQVAREAADDALRVAIDGETESRIASSQLKANKDGSNLDPESINEGNLDATSQAKLNANDGAFQGYHDCSGAAPSTVGLVANKDYYRVLVEGNGFTATDRMVFNGGSAGDYTDFTEAADSAPLPADKSISQAKLDVNITRRWDSAINDIWTGSISNPTATSFDVTGGLSQVARYFFDVFEGQIVRVSFNITSLFGLSSLTLRESNLSTVMGDKNFGPNDLIVGGNTIEFVAQKDQAGACVIFTYGSSNTGGSVTATSIQVYGDDDTEARETRNDRSDVDSIGALWGGRSFRTTRFLRSGDVANALSDGFTVPANESSTGFYGNFNVVVGQKVTLTFDCDDGSAISQTRLSELDGTVASNQVLSGFVTGSNTVELISIFAGEVRVQFVVAAGGSNVNITNFRCFIHGASESRIDSVESTATANGASIADHETRISTLETQGASETRVDGLEVRIGDLESLFEQVDHFAYFSTLSGSFSDGSSAVATMPALDFGTKDHSVSLICARPAHNSIIWSNVSANTGEQLWWNGDGTFTLKIGNGANLTTHVFTTANSAYVSVGELARVFVTIRRAGDMVVYINEVPLHADDGTIEFLDISSASAQTVSSGASWKFGSDGTNHYPLMLLGLATFEEGAPPFSEVTRRKKNPALWRSTVYRSKIILDDFNWDDLSSPNAVLTNNVDGQAGENDWVKLALEGDSDNTTHYLNIASNDAWFDSLENGDDLRIEILVYAPSANTVIDALRIDATASSSSETTQLVAVGFDIPTGYAYRLSGSGLVSGWSTDIGRLRIFLGSTANTSTFGDGGSTEAIYLKQPILFVNGLKRIIDFSESGLAKPDLIGSSDASRDASASDLI